MGSEQASLLGVIMLLFIAEWEAKVDLVGIILQLPALGLSLLLGVRDGCSGCRSTGTCPGEQPGGTSPSPTAELVPLYCQK